MESTIEVEANNGLEVGDTMTIAGVYEKRTFWQWLRRKSRQSVVFTITEETHSTITVDKVPFGN